MKTKTLIVVPAYGRRYETAEEVLVDWHGGKDFKVPGGVYLSKRESNLMLADGYGKVQVVYAIVNHKHCDIELTEFPNA